MDDDLNLVPIVGVGSYASVIVGSGSLTPVIAGAGSSDTVECDANGVPLTPQKE